MVNIKKRHSGKQTAVMEEQNIVERQSVIAMVSYLSRGFSYSFYVLFSLLLFLIHFLFSAIAKKEAAAAAVTAKKEAAAEAARQKKEAAAAKFWETGESIKSTTTSTTEYVKSSSSNAASSVNSGFWNVVTMAQKVKYSCSLES